MHHYLEAVDTGRGTEFATHAIVCSCRGGVCTRFEHACKVEVDPERWAPPIPLSGADAVCGRSTGREGRQGEPSSSRK